jgi:predicted TIM-barrel fold metal-dependent hydrolase
MHYNFKHPQELEGKRKIWDTLGYEQVWFSGDNKGIRELFKRYPDYIVGFAALKMDKGPHWRNPDVSHEHIDTPGDIVRYQEEGFHGLKVMLVQNPFSYKRYFALYEKAAELKMPILFHTGYTSGGVIQDYYRPNYLIDISQKIPELKIIMAHLGGQFFWEAIWAIMKCPHIYADISGGTMRYFPSDFYKMLFLRVPRNKTDSQLTSRSLTQKLVFGSDNPDDTLEFYKNFINALEIPNEIQELIYYKNAELLLSK